ncbi:MAG: hypothetical protein R2831_11780 [Chitinophagaceae bacterium]
MATEKSAKLDHLKALVGGFTDLQDNEIPFGMEVVDMILEKVKHTQYPIVFDFPVGHQPQNVAIKLGMSYHLSVHKDKVIFNEETITGLETQFLNS